MSVGWFRGGFRWVAMVVALVVGVGFAALFAGSAQATDANQVEFWCDQGIKVEPIGTPSYTVQPPPNGFVWTLLVVKSATDNEPFPNPIPGQSYTPSNGHDVSHVILCMEPIPATTTTSTTTTTTTSPPDPTTTTTPQDGTTATEPAPVGGVSAGGGGIAVGGWDLAVLWLIAGALALLGGALVFAVGRPRRGE